MTPLTRISPRRAGVVATLAIGAATLLGAGPATAAVRPAERPPQERRAHEPRDAQPTAVIARAMAGSQAQGATVASR